MLKVATQYVPCFYDHLYSMNSNISYLIAKDYCTKNSLETNYSNISVILNIQKGVGANVSAMLCAMQLFGGRHVSGNWLAYPPKE
jgi:hypothetical protein